MKLDNEEPSEPAFVVAKVHHRRGLLIVPTTRRRERRGWPRLRQERISSVGLLARATRALAASLVAVCALGCPDDLEIRVLPMKSDCVALDPLLCLVIEEGGQLDLLFDPIEGFSFQWCVEHELVVEKHRVPFPPPDASTVSYVHKETLGKKNAPAGEETRLALQPEWIDDSDGEPKLIGEFDIRCAEEALCEELLGDVQAGRIVLGTFRCPGGGEAPILVGLGP